MYPKRQSLPRVSRAVSDPPKYQVLRSDFNIYPSNSLYIAFVLISQKCDNSVFNKHSSINFIKINFIVSKQKFYSVLLDKTASETLQHNISSSTSLQ